MDTESKTGCDGRCADLSAFTFQMAFQPVVDVEQRRIHAYEALVRGENGESAWSVLSKVTDDTRYAFDQACRVKAIETAARLEMDRRLNINFMPNAVYHPEACLRLTLEAARTNEFPADRITFEFTEDERVVNHGHLLGIVRTYKAHGFKTALDDFGAGYAGLSLLADFQPNIIKIDRCLVTNIQGDAARQAVVAGVLTTAGMLGLSVVAEGVEQLDEVVTLRRMGVRLFQGYYFAKPVLGTLVRDDDIRWPDL